MNIYCRKGLKFRDSHTGAKELFTLWKTIVLTVKQTAKTNRYRWTREKPDMVILNNNIYVSTQILWVYNCTYYLNLQKHTVITNSTRMAISVFRKDRKVIVSIYLIIAIKTDVIKSIITHHFSFYDISFITKVNIFDELNIFKNHTNCYGFCESNY